MNGKCDKNINISTSVNLRLVNFLPYVKANRDSVGQPAGAINCYDIYSELCNKYGK
jgi:hypothetical protein